GRAAKQASLVRRARPSVRSTPGSATPGHRARYRTGRGVVVGRWAGVQALTPMGVMPKESSTSEAGTRTGARAATKRASPPAPRTLRRSYQFPPLSVMVLPILQV